MNMLNISLIRRIYIKKKKKLAKQFLINETENKK
jgi:hypothetical protein